MQVVILCGGMGTRAYPQTRTIPKALLPVADIPILEHVMQLYAHYGHTDFILALGYLQEAIIEHFSSIRYSHFNIDFVDTGAQTDTGGRIFQCADRLDGTFFATYCDGLSDINLDQLLRKHLSCVDRGGVATMTTVQLRSQYGIVTCGDEDRISGFQEKPLLPYWINGGFFVFEKEVFDFWRGENLEQDVLPHLAEEGSLFTYQHRGFWKSMDTHKDQMAMNEVWPPIRRELIERHAGLQSA